MRSLILIAFAAFLALAPIGARAQTVPELTPPSPNSLLGLPPGQAFAVGVGMIAGGVGMGWLTNGPLSPLIGAVAGALIGNWWYSSQPAHRVKATMYQLTADTL